MMKMIAKKVEFDGGIKLGHSVMMGYFEQDQEEKLDQKKTVFETIDEAAVGDVRKQVRGLLGSFLFRGDDIDKKVQVLSGGERGRLAICKLLLEPYNFLLMDEPTNHLDIRSKDILKKALINYEGTVIMVSHDRDFMKGICDRLFEFRDGKVKEHLCDIEDFMQLRKVERLNELDLEKKDNKEKKQEVTSNKNTSHAISSNEEINKHELEQKQIRNQIKKVEEIIENLESKIKDCDLKLSDASEYEKLVNNKSFFEEYNQFKITLEKEIEKWESLSEKLV